jgi:hypothetical protein
LVPLNFLKFLFEAQEETQKLTKPLASPQVKLEDKWETLYGLHRGMGNTLVFRCIVEWARPWFSIELSNWTTPCTLRKARQGMGIYVVIVTSGAWAKKPHNNNEGGLP